MEDTNHAGAATAASASADSCAPRTCPDCGKLVSKSSRSGLCRSDLLARRNKDPERRRQIAAERRAHFSRPGAREAHSRAVRKGMERLSTEERKRRSERGKITARDVLFQPEVRARTMAPEVRQRAGRAKTETILGWCPPHLRDTYRHLVNRKHIPAAEARAMIDAEVERQERARLAALTPLQRQIERLEKGATLTAKFTPRKAVHAFTLGGVGSGLL